MRGWLEGGAMLVSGMGCTMHAVTTRACAGGEERDGERGAAKGGKRRSGVKRGRVGQGEGKQLVPKTRDRPGCLASARRFYIKS